MHAHTHPQAGISGKHHDLIIGKLCNPAVIASSRQFPFRFLSAYEAIKLDPDAPKDPVEAANLALQKARMAKPAKKGLVKKLEKALTRAIANSSVPPPSEDLVERYREALDTAVQLATRYNVQPIGGSTVVFVNVGAQQMSQPMSGSARGLQPGITVGEVGILLALMFRYSCEDSKVSTTSTLAPQHYVLTSTPSPFSR